MTEATVGKQPDTWCGTWGRSAMTTLGKDICCHLAFLVLQTGGGISCWKNSCTSSHGCLKPRDWCYHQYPRALEVSCAPQKCEFPQISMSVPYQRDWSHPNSYTFIKEILCWLAGFPSWRFLGTSGLLLVGDRVLILWKGEMETAAHKGPDLI